MKVTSRLPRLCGLVAAAWLLAGHGFDPPVAVAQLEEVEVEIDLLEKPVRAEFHLDTASCADAGAYLQANLPVAGASNAVLFRDGAGWETTMSYVPSGGSPKIATASGSVPLAAGVQDKTFFVSVNSFLLPSQTFCFGADSPGALPTTAPPAGTCRVEAAATEAAPSSCSLSECATLLRVRPSITGEADILAALSPSAEVPCRVEARDSSSPSGCAYSRIPVTLTLDQLVRGAEVIPLLVGGGRDLKVSVSCFFDVWDFPTHLGERLDTRAGDRIAEVDLSSGCACLPEVAVPIVLGPPPAATLTGYFDFVGQDETGTELKVTRSGSGLLGTAIPAPPAIPANRFANEYPPWKVEHLPLGPGLVEVRLWFDDGRAYASQSYPVTLADEVTDLGMTLVVAPRLVDGTLTLRNLPPAASGLALRENSDVSGQTFSTLDPAANCSDLSNRLSSSAKLDPDPPGAGQETVLRFRLPVFGVNSAQGRPDGSTACVATWSLQGFQLRFGNGPLGFAARASGFLEPDRLLFSGGSAAENEAHPEIHLCLGSITVSFAAADGALRLYAPAITTSSTGLGYSIPGDPMSGIRDVIVEAYGAPARLQAAAAAAQVEAFVPSGVQYDLTASVSIAGSGSTISIPGIKVPFDGPLACGQGYGVCVNPSDGGRPFAVDLVEGYCLQRPLVHAVAVNAGSGVSRIVTTVDGGPESSLPGPPFSQTAGVYSVPVTLPADGSEHNLRLAMTRNADGCTADDSRWVHIVRDGDLTCRDLTLPVRTGSTGIDRDDERIAGQLPYTLDGAWEHYPEVVRLQVQSGDFPIAPGATGRVTLTGPCGLTCTVNLTALPPDEPETVITSPQSDQVLSLCNAVAVTGTATAPAGSTISAVAFGSSPAGSTPPLPLQGGWGTYSAGGWSFEWHPGALAEGDYVIGSQGFDDAGRSERAISWIPVTLEKRWESRVGEHGPDMATAVAAGRDGSVYVVGVAPGAAAGPHHDQAFVARYGGCGERLAYTRFGSTADDIPYAVAQGADGDLYVVGTTFGDIDGADLTNSFSGKSDVFVAKADGQTGEIRWVRQFGSPGYDGALGVATDSNGNAYLAGYAQRIYPQIAVSPGVPRPEAPRKQPRDQWLPPWLRGAAADTGRPSPGVGMPKPPTVAFLAKFSSAGDLEWLSSDDTLSLATDVAVSASGAVVTGTRAVTEGGSQSLDSFVARYDAGGNRLQVVTSGIAGADIATDIGQTGTGDVVVGGMSGTLDLDVLKRQPHLLVPWLGCALSGERGSFVARGAQGLEERIAIPGVDVVADLAVGEQGQIAAIGWKTRPGGGPPDLAFVRVDGQAQVSVRQVPGECSRGTGIDFAPGGKLVYSGWFLPETELPAEQQPPVLEQIHGLQPLVGQRTVAPE